jgi:hypothetical protein
VSLSELTQQITQQIPPLKCPFPAESGKRPPVATNEVEAVLSNWISQALAPTGRIPEGVTPSELVRWTRRIEGVSLSAGIPGRRSAYMTGGEPTLAGGAEKAGTSLDSPGEIHGLSPPTTTRMPPLPSNPDRMCPSSAKGTSTL